MARRPREISNSRFYHVYSRGAGGLVLFADDTDCRAQYGLYGTVVRRHGWKIHAHCLLTTHHHVLVEVPHAALVRGMHLLGTCQAMRLNRRRERFGHASAGRFGSAALHTHADVARVALAIPNDPVEAGLVDDPRAYPWTSHRATLGIDARPAWLDTDWLPRLFATTSANGVARYADRVHQQAAVIVAGRPTARSSNGR